MIRRTAALTLAAGLCLGIGNASADTIRIAHIDPLSGPFALVGESTGRQLQAAVDDVNAKGGVLGGTKLELAHFDNKGSPQETMLLLKQIIDSGTRFISLGTGSHIAHALVDALEKHNARNPDKTVLLLNVAAQDPPLTGDKCSFWHFRWEAHTDMRVKALTDYIVSQKGSPKVYLLNQDYAFGQAISRAAREMLKAKRPDIQIVGDDLHPLGKVKDFAPYISKIKASGAQAVITGNWGNDLALLVKASKEAGLAVEYYTYYGGVTGTPPAIGESGVGHVKMVSAWHANVGTPHAAKIHAAYRERYRNAKDDYFFNLSNVLEMLVKAMETAKSIDPLPVARAMEGMKFQADTGEVTMRADNHQLIQPIYISTFARIDGKATKLEVDRSGYGFRTDTRIESKNTVLPTTCKMERP